MIEHIVRPSPSSTFQSVLSARRRAAAFTAAATATLLFVPSLPGLSGAPHTERMIGIPTAEGGDTDGYFIDKTEVTVAAYRHCVDAGECTSWGLKNSSVTTAGRMQSEPSDLCNWGRWGRDHHPLNCVSWRQAQTYCRWAGKRLPSKKEWMRAAQGPSTTPFPWGTEQPTCRFAVVDGCDPPGLYGRQRFGATRQVGSLPAGRSPFGALDMVGNVAEWTADSVLSTERPLVEVLGGSWAHGTAMPSVTKGSIELFVRDVATGFRCVR